MNVLLMEQTDDGKIIEGPYPASDVALGPGFKEYRFLFRTRKDRPESLNFYKVAATDADKGIDIASVKLLAGRQVDLNILPIYRGGRGARGQGKRPVAGTEAPLRKNPYGVWRSRLNVLAVGYDARTIRTVSTFWRAQ